MCRSLNELRPWFQKFVVLRCHEVLEIWEIEMVAGYIAVVLAVVLVTVIVIVVVVVVVIVVCCCRPARCCSGAVVVCGVVVYQ